MGDMVNKTVVFLAVDGFEARAFEALWQCFGWQKNAATRIASFNADDQIISMDGLVNTHSDMSFAEASEMTFDVLVVADGITADAIMNDLAAKTALMNANDRSSAIVSIGEGAKALIAAGIINGRTVAAPPNLRDELMSAGAILADEPMAESDNIFSASGEADLKALCDIVSDYITGLSKEVA